MPHGPGETTGFRFETDGKSVAYATDYSAITDDMIELFHGADILVSDCLRREPHPTHANLALALDLAERCKAQKLVLSHLDKCMNYASIESAPPAPVFVGFDWMSLIV